MTQREPVNTRRRLIELAAVFGKLGAVGFGGPAAHIAMMEREVVVERRWLDRQRFLDLVGATNLIPGPNSTEMAIHVGFLRGGWLGLLVAGTCFIFPAFVITAALSWAYVRFGSLPEIKPWLTGIQPVVLAVIVVAVWRLGRTAMKGYVLAVVGLGVAAATMLGINEVAALLAGGVIGMFCVRFAKSTGVGAGALLAALSVQLPARKVQAAAYAIAALPLAGATVPAAVSLWKLALFFLKVGCILYGSGYVLVAFLEDDLVRGYGWLTQQQLIDAVAIGQLTPGPVLTTATCVGYMVGGLGGAVIATVAIFLPSFFFVAVLNPLIGRLRQSRWASAFLDAINVSAVALMAAVSVRLGAAVLWQDGQPNWQAWLIAMAAIVLTRWKINAVWLVLGGAVAGRLMHAW